MLLQLANFIITFSIFPGILVSKKFNFISISYETVIVVLIFNIFDTIGKMLAGKVISTNRSIIIIVLLRLSFIPLAIAIHMNKSGIFNEYWFFIATVVFTSLSHGYASNSLNYLPTLAVNEKDDKKLVGFYMSLIFFSGLLSGSLLALFYI